MTNNTKTTIHSELMEQLLSLRFEAFAQCIADLLLAEGCQNVHLAGRASYRGRNKEGGYDLQATLPSTPLFDPIPDTQAQRRRRCRRVIVQIKQFPSTLRVYQRTVDELRGVCLRVGATEAILITTSEFSPTVREQATAAENNKGTFSFPIVPVHLLGGTDLVERLLFHQIGVKIDKVGKLILDSAYFKHLNLSPTKQPASKPRTATILFTLPLPSPFTLLIVPARKGSK